VPDKKRRPEKILHRRSVPDYPTTRICFIAIFKGSREGWYGADIWGNVPGVRTGFLKSREGQNSNGGTEKEVLMRSNSGRRGAVNGLRNGSPKTATTSR